MRHHETTIFYLAARHTSKELARESVRRMLRIMEVSAVGAKTFEAALQLPGPDFEDNVICESARAAGIGTIITRDEQGYRSSGLEVLSPREFLLKYRRG